MLPSRLCSTRGIRYPIEIGALLLIIVSAFYSTSSLADLRQTLDWIAYEQLTLKQQAQLPIGSCGAYISPLADLDNTPNTSLSPTEASSNESKIEEKNGLKHITFIGDVIVKQGAQMLTAEQAVYSEKTGTIVIEGELTVRQPDLLLIAEKGVVNQRENRLAIDDATYVIHSANIRGKGKQLTKNQQLIDLQESEYTSCEPGNNDWVLRGSQITIDTEKNQGVAKHVRLVVKGIPVFYWPYLRFPVGSARQSGFLYPVIASNNGAIDVSIPYYFNLAPNYDLTLTPHFLENHGALIDAKGRHLNEKFETDITLAHLANDKGVLSDSEQAKIDSGAKTDAEANAFKGDDRWLININQIGGKNQRWFSTIDYNEVSDNDYLDDFDNSGINSSNDTSLSQQITAGYQFENWRFEINNQQYQILDDTISRPYKLLPEITLDGEYNFGGSSLGDMNITLDNEWTHFAHSDADDAGDTTLVGDRVRFTYASELDHSSEAGFIRPRIQARYLAYQLEESTLASGANSTPSVIVPQAIVDAGLYFERDGDGHQQTFEPRLYYFYSPFKDQSDITGSDRNVNFDTSNITFSYNQLFNDTRFAGGDRIDDANQLSMGLTTRFIDNESGLEWFSASIGKAIYFNERRVTLSGTTDTANNSPIAGRFSSQFSKHWRLTNNFIYNDDSGNIDDNTLSIKYRGDNSSLLNFSHRFLRNDISASTTQQSQASLIFPLAGHSWYVFAHADFDHTNNRDLEQLLGFEYNSCCYRARFAYKRFIDDGGLNSAGYDEGLLLEFQFLGLGGTGSQFSRLFEETIDGFEQWQATYREN
ncbi:MAG: LPS-assembly protein [Candidatus Endobugula sp.]|jgi:LPS-assembly protein